ncbi:biotin/lipoyl-containing protein [Roseibium sp. M-1]
MPHEVIMPALGMAQDTGLLLAWHKKPGEAVAAGDVLFEVETDKAAMEVEAQAEGFLTNVTGEAGSEIPVGKVIALISETQNGASEARLKNTASDEVVSTSGSMVIDGHKVIMPSLGMAQDTGLLIAWLKQPGDEVTADDVLFEVETDKSTMEVNAGQDGFIAALLAEAGDEIPVGDTIAIISATKPVNPRTVGAKDKEVGTSSPLMKTTMSEPEPAKPSETGATKPALAPTALPFRSDGKILASPKARRLATERGVDLHQLVKAGLSQPFHAKDVETFKMSAIDESTSTTTSATRYLCAELDQDGFAEFATWAAAQAGLQDPMALIAGLAGASLGKLPATVVVETTFGEMSYLVPTAGLEEVSVTDSAEKADLRVRDLRASQLRSVQLGTEECPVLTLLPRDKGLSLTLECADHQLAAKSAIDLLSNFAGRMKQPLRHLL